MERFHDGNQWRALGCLPRPRDARVAFPRLEEVIDVLPRSEWEEYSLKPQRLRCQDQGNQGSCNAAAATCAVESVRKMAGMSLLELSRGNLYGQINGGRDQGSLLGDALEALLKNGTVPNGVIGDDQWQRSTWPRNWEEEAKPYRILEAYYCPTFAHMATAVQYGYFLDFGIMVGNNFQPDSSGWLPDYQSGYGGHAMAGFGLARHRDGRWGIETSNSWGSRWGNNGWCYVPESYFEDEWWADGWAVRAAIVNEDDSPPPMTF
jgi:hypothetical protein